MTWWEKLDYRLTPKQQKDVEVMTEKVAQELAKVHDEQFKTLSP